MVRDPDPAALDEQLPESDLGRFRAPPRLELYYQRCHPPRYPKHFFFCRRGGTRYAAWETVFSRFYMEPTAGVEPAPTAGRVTGIASPAFLDPFPIVVGIYTAALFAFLSPAYLAVEATGALREDFRRRALIAVTTGLVGHHFHRNHRDPG